MPAELTDDTGEIIRKRGKEWGVNTGRPRRTGWFDAVAAHQTSRLNGVSEIAITLVDVLDPFPAIKLCVGYRKGETLIPHVPALLDNLDNAAPVWEEVEGWEIDTTATRAYGELPPQLHHYVDVIESKLGASVRYIGVGPSRDQLIDRLAT